MKSGQQLRSLSRAPPSEPHAGQRSETLQIACSRDAQHGRRNHRLQPRTPRRRARQRRRQQRAELQRRRCPMNAPCNAPCRAAFAAVARPLGSTERLVATARAHPMDGPAAVGSAIACCCNLVCTRRRLHQPRRPRRTARLHPAPSALQWPLVPTPIAPPRAPAPVRRSPTARSRAFWAQQHRRADS